MSEMVDRVAAAINEAFTGGLRGDWLDQSEENKQEWRECARAAIAAMREPTEAMRQAADKETYQLEPNVSWAWEIMIDEALK